MISRLSLIVAAFVVTAPFFLLSQWFGLGLDVIAVGGVMGCRGCSRRSRRRDRGSVVGRAGQESE